MSSPGLPAIFRRDADGALRQLRHLPRAGPDLGRHHRQPEGALSGPPDGRALRPEPSDRPSARPRERPDGAAGHDRLPTFGVGSDLDRRTWQSVFRQLVAGGFLEVDVDGYGGMRLAGDAAKVLRGERALQLRHDPTPARGRSRARGAPMRRPPASQATPIAICSKRSGPSAGSSPRRTVSHPSWCSRTGP